MFCFFGAREGRVDGNLNLSEPRQLLGVNLQFSLHGRFAQSSEPSSHLYEDFTRLVQSGIRRNRRLKLSRLTKTYFDIFPRVYTLRSREICRAEQSKTCIYCILFNNARAKKTKLLSKTAQGLEQSGICFTRGRDPVSSSGF